MIPLDTVYSNITGTGLNTQAKNATGAGVTNGTEFIAAGLNNGPEFGFMQSIMDYATGEVNAPTGTVGVPNNVSEGIGVSQIIQAIEKGFAIGPGKLVGWFLNDDPSVTLDRVLLLQGQGVLVATYPDLDAAVWVGGNTAFQETIRTGGGKFYRSSDAAGTTGDAAGAWLQLPEGRGYALRGLDLAASVDPLGASRFLGDNQIANVMKHNHQWHRAGGATIAIQTTSGSTVSSFDSAANVKNFGGGSISGDYYTKDEVFNLSGDNAMVNLSIQFGITY